MPFRHYLNKRNQHQRNLEQPMEVDRDISIDERTKQTLVPAMFPVHEFLCRKLGVYSAWYKNPYSNTINWLAAGTSVLVAMVVISSSLFPSVRATGSTWTQSSQADFNAGTATGLGITNTDGGEVAIQGFTFNARRAVVADNSSGGVVNNAQVNVTLNVSNFNFTKTRSDGHDIRFMDSDDSTQLSYWVKSWDSVAQTASIWVKVPKITAGQKRRLFIHYGSANATDAETNVHVADGTSSLPVSVGATIPNLSATTAMPGWAYRTAIPIDNTAGSTLTNYQLAVLFDAKELSNNGQLQANAADLRFTDSDGTTLLNYWLETSTITRSTQVWVKVPSIPGGASKTIYMYYGNGGAISASSASSTFVDDLPVLGAWGFNDGSGTITSDSSGNGLAGSLVGSPTWTTGKFGGALSFDGSGTDVNLNNPASLQSSSVTLSVWYKPSGSPVDYPAFFGHGTGGWVMGLDTGNSGKIFVAQSGQLPYIDSTTIPNDPNIWYHIVATISGSTTKIYVNGSLEATSDATPAFTFANSLSIGRDNGAGGAINGVIDQARIYSGALSAGQIADLATDTNSSYFTSNYSGHELLYQGTIPHIYSVQSTPMTIASPSGTYTSAAFDTGQISSLSTIDWDATTPGNSSIAFQIRSADTQGGLATASWYGPTSTSDYYTISGAAINSIHSGNRWIQYQAVLATDNSANLPILNSVSIGYTAADKTFSTGTSTIGGDGQTYTVNNLTVSGGSTLNIVGGTTLNVLGTLTVTDNSTILVQGKNTNTQSSGAGATISANSVAIDSGSHISADGQGYIGNDCSGAGFGPGGGTLNCNNNGIGGTYGGAGGGNSRSTYGNAFTPTDLGSGGSGSCCTGPSGSAGGGAIRLTVAVNLQLDGTITANGNANSCGGIYGTCGGAGSGGSVYITTGSLAGAGSVSANGGNGGANGVAGGGGRIAVYYSSGDLSDPTTSLASGGSASPGLPGGTGTVLFSKSNHLYIHSHFVIPSNTTATYDGISVDNGASLLVNGGSNLSINNDLAITGNSTVTIQSINTTSKVSGVWAGAGSTIHAANIQVESGSHISADGQGYTGTSCGDSAGNGPGGGAFNCNNWGNSGGYGGLGGGPNKGAIPVYGSQLMPIDLGSGGSGGYFAPGGGSGGGAIRLIVSGTLTNNGDITSSGNGSSGGSGGGSGGSVYITTQTLEGSGNISANGGNSETNLGGGGGRVAVYYSTDGGFNPTKIIANAGTAGSGNNHGDNGTVYLIQNGNLTVSSDLTLSNDTALSLSNIIVNNGATFTIGGGSNVSLSGNLTVTGNSTISVLSKDSATQVNGQWVGAGATISAAQIQIDNLSKISADGQGYPGSDCSSFGKGPGGAPVDCNNAGIGGSYGGLGGGSSPAAVYGSASHPTDLGSGGSGGYFGTNGGAGGGAIRLNASDLFINNGTITANGVTTGCGTSCGGGGSGGSIYVTTDTLTGAGSFTANGGNQTGGQIGGGGGRVAIYYKSLSNDSTTHTANAGSLGVNGTVVFSALPITSLSTADAQLFGPTPALSFVVSDPEHRSLGAELEYMPRAGDSCSSQSWSPATVVESSTPVSWSGNGQYLDGNTVTYTFSTITSGTYCWRAAAKPLSGSFTDYGDWSEARAFTVDASAPDNFVVNTDVNNHVFTHSSDIPTSVNGTIADDANGQGIPANAVTLTLERLTDSQYWNGSAWIGNSATFPATNTATTGNATATWLASSLPTWTEGNYAITAQAVDKVGNQTMPKTSKFTYDKTPPVTVSTVYDGTVTGKETQYSTTTGTISANWPATTDAVSAIAKYEYAIGTAMGGSNTVSWTDNGTDLSFTKTGLTLTAGATYYVSVVAEDAVGNVSAIQVSAGTIVDTQAPATVTDLTAQPASSTSMTVYWTAPGDDGTAGTATSYDLRMSTSQITNDNFAQATAVTNAPTPTAAGNTQQLTVSNLTTGTTYYFALKTTDKAAHTSALSNIAKSETEADSTAGTVPAITPVAPPAPTPIEFNCLTSAASSQNTPIELNFTAATSLDQSKLTETSNAPTVIIGVRNIDQTLNNDLKSANLLGKDPTNIAISPANPAQVKAITFSINNNQIALNSNAAGDGCVASVIPPNAKGSYTAEANVYYKDGTVETRQLALLIDPSGYVYEQSDSGQTRLSGVTVTLKVKSGDQFVNWDGTSYQQTNPQITGTDGQYEFFVPAGTYKVTAEKPGYNTYTSSEIVITNAPVDLGISLTKNNLSLLVAAGASIRSVLNVVKQAVLGAHTLASPIATNSVAKTAQATTTLTAAAVALTATALPMAANLPLLDIFGQFFAAVVSLIAPRKKRSSLGQVVDSESGRPVAGAVVRILDSVSAKVLETQVTDIHGNFGFLVNPGTYQIEVSKTNYQFPSKLTVLDYHGGSITVATETPLKMTIPIDPELQTLSNRMNSLLSVSHIISLLRLPILSVGTVFTIIFMLGQPNLVNGTALAFYALAWIYEILQSILTARSIGNVADVKTQAGLGLAIVRLAKADGKLVASKVSNQNGHFLVQAAPGEYKVTVTRRGYQQLQNVLWQTKKHETLAKEFKLENLGKSTLESTQINNPPQE